ncbi:hypothetical protein RFI_14850 [Reticulomyxa filosa]|uniref:Uncharacterized protein n=1 Tax=Reticulomyxa filosa TaxID=46433 RepID=X6NAL7_RETFI|nr:hypothetical protein RFI_14850 [Reticulomyxa filosa]|eukprot:ETO22347.1 hypothetical protein RFI_14850 [Reticulomyxa filosa]
MLGVVNVLAGNNEHKTMALQRDNLLSTLITISKQDIQLVRKEAIIALANASCDASVSNVQLLVDAGVIETLINYLKEFNMNSTLLVDHIVVVILEALIHICGTGEETNPTVYCNKLEQCDGLTVLEELQSNEHLSE